LSSGVAAFFDVDGTLTRTTILDPLIWYQRAHLPRWQFRLWLTGLLLHGPYYLWVDRRSRSRVNVLIYRRYAGVPLEQLGRWHREHFAATLRRRLFPGALECIRDHQRQGHRVVLVTGGLDLVLQPLAEFVGAEHLIAMQLCQKDGLCTGELGLPPIADQQKAVLVREYAKTHDIDLGRSFAYGDSYGDLPLLECVGQPAAVRPDRRLRALAQARGWRIVRWGRK
jgi:HAD superfamily hydrolase (TIGR01490 family)